MIGVVVGADGVVVVGEIVCNTVVGDGVVVVSDRVVVVGNRVVVVGDRVEKL